MLDKISIKIHKNDRIGLLGDNGTGKSTFLKALLGQIPCTHGTIKLKRDMRFSYFDHFDNLSFLKTEVDQCISQEGEILDHASSALYDAIQTVQGLKTRIKRI